MMRTLVTGGSGFIGKHLVAALIARGRQVGFSIFSHYLALWRRFSMSVDQYLIAT
jgi:nucleoside-diphosphate-sugar epimerase